MIRLLLFAVVISPAVQAAGAPQPCPEDAACLYHFTCIGNKAVPIFATVDGARFNDWKKSECNKHNSVVTELKIRPYTNRKWHFSLTYPNAGVKIEFGDLFEIMVDTEQKHPEYIEPMDHDSTYSFTVDAPDNQYERFKDSQISIIDGDDNGGSQQPLFWERILKLTKCDASLIVDTKGENSTLVQDEKTIDCKTDKLWIHNNDPLYWKELSTLTCGPNKEWEAIDANMEYFAHDGKFNLQCSHDKPAPWSEPTTSSSTTTTTTTTTAPETAANTTTTTESPETTSKPASSILSSVIIPIIISGLHLLQ